MRTASKWPISKTFSLSQIQQSIILIVSTYYLSTSISKFFWSLDVFEEQLTFNHSQCPLCLLFQPLDDSIDTWRSFHVLFWFSKWVLGHCGIAKIDYFVIFFGPYADNKIKLTSLIILACIWRIWNSVKISQHPLQDENIHQGSLQPGGSGRTPDDYWLRQT